MLPGEKRSLLDILQHRTLLHVLENNPSFLTDLSHRRLRTLIKHRNNNCSRWGCVSQLHMFPARPVHFDSHYAQPYNPPSNQCHAVSMLNNHIFTGDYVCVSACVCRVARSTMCGCTARVHFVLFRFAGVAAVEHKPKKCIRNQRRGGVWRVTLIREHRGMRTTIKTNH